MPPTLISHFQLEPFSPLHCTETPRSHPCVTFLLSMWTIFTQTLQGHFYTFRKISKWPTVLCLWDLKNAPMQRKTEKAALVPFSSLYHTGCAALLLLLGQRGIIHLADDLCKQLVHHSLAFGRSFYKRTAPFLSQSSSIWPGHLTLRFQVDFVSNQNQWHLLKALHSHYLVTHWSNVLEDKGEDVSEASSRQNVTAIVVIPQSGSAVILEYYRNKVKFKKGCMGPF